MHNNNFSSPNKQAQGFVRPIKASHNQQNQSHPPNKQIIPIFKQNLLNKQILPNQQNLVNKNVIKQIGSRNPSIPSDYLLPLNNNNLSCLPSNLPSSFQFPSLKTNLATKIANTSIPNTSIPSKTSIPPKMVPIHKNSNILPIFPPKLPFNQNFVKKPSTTATTVNSIHPKKPQKKIAKGTQQTATATSLQPHKTVEKENEEWSRMEKEKLQKVEVRRVEVRLGVLESGYGHKRWYWKEKREGSEVVICDSQILVATPLYAALFALLKSLFWIHFSFPPPLPLSFPPNYPNNKESVLMGEKQVWGETNLEYQVSFFLPPILSPFFPSTNDSLFTPPTHHRCSELFQLVSFLFSFLNKHFSSSFCVKDFGGKKLCGKGTKHKVQV